MSISVHLPLNIAHNAFFTLITSLILVFISMIILINIMLYIMVIKPVTALAEKANEVSLGALHSEGLTIKGKNEISSLGQSFNRMHQNLTNAVHF